jgi:hypothetical protein
VCDAYCAVCWSHTYASGAHTCFHKVFVNTYAPSSFGQGVVMLTLKKVGAVRSGHSMVGACYLI